VSILHLYATAHPRAGYCVVKQGQMPLQNSSIHEAPQIAPTPRSVQIAINRGRAQRNKFRRPLTMGWHTF